MNHGDDGISESRARLSRAVSAWVGHGRARPLAQWLDRFGGVHGVPVGVPVPCWVDCLAELTAARRGRSDDWPDEFDARIEGLFRSVLRFSRPDGTPVFDSGEGHVDSRTIFRSWADWLPDAGLATVVNWWFPKKATSYAPPPLPSFADDDRPLAMLRANWSKQGDFLAVDHRARGPACAFELFGLGRTWLGPTWTAGTGDAPATPARPRLWLSNSSVDLLEWAFRAGETRVIRTALILRGRRLALLADQVEGREPLAAIRIAVPEPIAARPTAKDRGLVLSSDRKPRASMRVLPVGLPRLPYETERGSFTEEGREIVLRQRQEGRRCWLPLLASWDPVRNRKGVQWRVLTVSEKSKPCAPETAFAVRVSWGRDDTLVIYRSLGRPAIRSFLGHQTSARFLVGLFDKAGDVKPILKVDD